MTQAEVIAAVLVAFQAQKPIDANLCDSVRLTFAANDAPIAARDATILALQNP